MSSQPAAPAPTGATPAPSSLPTKPTSTPPVLSPASVDAFLTHLQACLQTPAGIDTVLQFTCFTSRLAAAVLASTSNHILARSARHLVALILALPPRTTVLLSTSPTGKPSPAVAGAAATLVLAKRLKALSGLLSEARTITRLWALLGMYFWAKRVVAQIGAYLSSSSSQDEKATGVKAPTAAAVLLSTLQLASCIAFQSLENAAFLSAKGVMGLTPIQQAKAGRWSARFWGVFVGMEIGRLAVELYARNSLSSTGKLSVEEQEKEYGEVVGMRKAMVRNMAWAPLTVHWGSEVGFIPEMGIAAIACIPSVLGMRDLWRSTAK